MAMTLPCIGALAVILTLVMSCPSAVDDLGVESPGLTLGGIFDR
jgi:hypothetical protein